MNPFADDIDMLLEKTMEDPDSLPKTRYLQAYVKYLKIQKLSKEYKGHLGNSGRIRDLLKDCLNDMEMALEIKFGKRYHNSSWELWMHELADLRNQAIHSLTIFAMKKTIGAGKDNETEYYLRAVSLNGRETVTKEEALTYLEKTLGLIKAKLNISEL